MRSAKARLRDLTAHKNIEGARSSHTATSGPSTSNEEVSSLALMDGFIKTISLNTYIYASMIEYHYLVILFCRPKIALKMPEILCRKEAEMKEAQWKYM